MYRTAAFGFALFTALTPASAAEPVEAAISGWVAAIDATPDWSAKFGDLKYDQATDTAVLSGLTIVHVKTGVSIDFKPISIAGYAEQANGTFSADNVVVEGAALKTSGFAAAIEHVRFDGLGNIARDLHGAVEWDPQRPFTSWTKAFAHFADIRLAHASVGSVYFEARENDAVVMNLEYNDVELDNWIDGKIASTTTGAISMTSLAEHEPFSMTIDSVEARNIDQAAMLRIYDPDQYVGGVGDGVWRNATEYVGYGPMVFDSPEAKLTFGKVSMEDFRVRQPERSFNDVFDRAMLNPQDHHEPTPEELRALFGYLSSFAIGSITLQGLTVEGKDGGGGHLGEMRFVDVSAERLGEFSLNDVKVSPPGHGSVSVGHLAFGGIVFPPLQALVDAAEAEKAGQDFDYARLATQLGFFEARGVDVDIPDSPRFTLDKARLDLGNYVGPIPTVVALDIAGADMPASAIEEPKVRALWQALGYDRVRGDFGARVAWNENDDSVTIDDFRLALDDVGALSLSAVLGGLTREALTNLDSWPEAFAGLSFVRGTLSLDNYRILDHWIDQQAALTGAAPDAVRQQIAVMLAQITSNIGDAGFQTQLQQVLEASVMVPGSVTASATPSTPIPLVALGVLGQTAPASLPELLGLTIESTSAP